MKRLSEVIPTDLWLEHLRRYGAVGDTFRKYGKDSPEHQEAVKRRDETLEQMRALVEVDEHQKEDKQN